MKSEEITEQLKEKAEKIVNFTPKEIDDISTDEIQRLFYDLQVYQIELEMQNDELKKSQRDVVSSRNRFHFLYHQIPVGIVTVNHLGFISDTNQYFCQMLKMNSSSLIKKHLTRLIVEEDKNQFINRFDAFFKSPDDKSINLRLKDDQDRAFHVKMLGKLDDAEIYPSVEIDKVSLVITVTNIDDIVARNT